MAASKAFIIAVATTIALVVQSASAANFTVGAPGGSWDLRTNFTSWAASNTFVPGDNLIFSYSPQQHNVLEVSKASYDSCSTGGPIKSYASGNDVIPLPAAATRYFICGFPTHCLSGMKVAIPVAALPPPPASSSPPPTSPGASPPASSPTPPPSSSPPPASSSGASAPASPPPSSSPPVPTSPGSSAPSAPPPPPQTPGSSGANGRGGGVLAKAAAGLGIGALLMLAL